MALAGSKWTGPLSYRRTNVSVLSSGFCSGAGGSLASSFRKTFRTCLRTNSLKLYANKCDGHPNDGAASSSTERAAALAPVHDRTFIRQGGYLRWASRYAAFQFHKRVLRRDLPMRLPTGASFILPRSRFRKSTSPMPILIGDRKSSYRSSQIASATSSMWARRLAIIPTISLRSSGASMLSSQRPLTCQPCAAMLHYAQTSKSSKR
jgi:hypothetical protein